MGGLHQFVVRHPRPRPAILIHRRRRGRRVGRAVELGRCDDRRKPHARLAVDGESVARRPPGRRRRRGLARARGGRVGGGDNGRALGVGAAQGVPASGLRRRVDVGARVAARRRPRRVGGGLRGRHVGRAAALRVGVGVEADARVGLESVVVRIVLARHVVVRRRRGRQAQGARLVLDEGAAPVLLRGGGQDQGGGDVGDDEVDVAEQLVQDARQGRQRGRPAVHLPREGWCCARGPHQAGEAFLPALDALCVLVRVVHAPHEQHHKGRHQEEGPCHPSGHSADARRVSGVPTWAGGGRDDHDAGDRNHELDAPQGRERICQGCHGCPLGDFQRRAAPAREKDCCFEHGHHCEQRQRCRHERSHRWRHANALWARHEAKPEAAKDREPGGVRDAGHAGDRGRHVRGRVPRAAVEADGGHSGGRRRVIGRLMGRRRRRDAAAVGARGRGDGRPKVSLA